MPQLRFSSIHFPEKERASAFQEIYASLANVEIEPYPNQPSYIDLEGHLLPNLEICRIDISPHIARHTTRHVAAENRDNLTLVISQTSSAYFDFKNLPSASLNRGDAVLISSDSVHVVDSIHPGDTIVVNCPRTLIAPRLANLGNSLMKKVATAGTPELALLKSYVITLIQTREELSPLLVQLASSHIADLLTLLLGATKDETEIAENRGLRAMRMQAVKQDIQSHLTENELSIDQVAKRQGISPQYVRSLFNREETTFSDYVNQQRLELAYRILSNPLAERLNILTIAYDVGFGNVSWFNSLFKKRFGVTPSDVRGSKGIC